MWTNDGGKTKKSKKDDTKMAANSDDNDNDHDDGDIVGHGDEDDVEDEGNYSSPYHYV